MNELSLEPQNAQFGNQKLEIKSTETKKKKKCLKMCDQNVIKISDQHEIDDTAINLTKISFSDQEDLPNCVL